SLTVAGRQVPLFLGKLIGLEQAEFTVTGAIRIDAPGVEWETSGPFVVLGGKGREERGFDTLAEAVEASERGDAIEVRGNGPFESNPIDLGRSALTIRAAEGFRPVIRFGRGSQGPRSFSRPGPLLRAGGPIVLEGLELQRRPYLNTRSVLVQCEGESVHAANCRFRLDGKGSQVALDVETGSCVARNCEFFGPGFVSVAARGPVKTHTLDNCVHVGEFAHEIDYGGPHPAGAELRYTRNTVVATGAAV